MWFRFMISGMKRKILLILSAGIAYIALFLMLSQYDLHVSRYLTEREISLIVFAGERFGPMPVYLIPAWCLRALSSETKTKTLYMLAEAALCIAAGWVAVYPELYSLTEVLMILFIAALAFGLVCILPLPELSPRSRKILRLGIMITAGSFFTVQFMKLLWGRPRYVAILNDGADFAEWFRIAGFALREDYYKSFPSGHTVSAAALFFITYLPDLFPSLPQKPWIWWGTAFLYTFAVAFSRIMASMHFVSDVMAAFGVYMMWYLVFSLRFEQEESRACDMDSEEKAV